MSKESKVVQVYPSDAKVQESMDENAIFGWEVINNQKFQEFTHSSIGLFSNTNHYSTYVKITYQRERSESWYPRVAELEKEYESLNNKIRRLRRRTDLKMITHHFFLYFFLTLFIFFCINAALHPSFNGLVLFEKYAGSMVFIAIITPFVINMIMMLG